jgi:hypothetical protein
MERGQMDDGGAVPQILGAVAPIEHTYLAYRLSYIHRSIDTVYFKLKDDQTNRNRNRNSVLCTSSTLFDLLGSELRQALADILPGLVAIDK